MINDLTAIDRAIAHLKSLRQRLVARAPAPAPAPRRGQLNDPWLEPLRGLAGAPLELDGVARVSVTLAQALAAVGATTEQRGAMDRAARCLARLGWTRRRLTRIDENGRRGYHYVRPVSA